MSYRVSIAIDAPLERVWSVLTDIERWPQSTASITSLERLDHGPFQRGSQARIKQPKIPPVVWTVTDFEPLRQFTWSTVAAGVTTTAGHVLVTGPGAGVTVTLSIERTGLLAPVMDLLFGGLTRQYVNMEIQGLKRVCEASSAVAAA